MIARPLVLTSLLLGWIASACAAPVDPAQDARYRRAASCVAALKAEVQLVRSRNPAGSAAARPELLRLTEWGFAIIGTAYKAGLRKAEADPMLADAEAAHKRLSPEAQRQLATECRAEGARLMKDANFVERALVSNRAKARVDDLLQAEAKR